MDEVKSAITISGELQLLRQSNLVGGTQLLSFEGTEPASVCFHFGGRMVRVG